MDLTARADWVVAWKCPGRRKSRKQSGCRVRHGMTGSPEWVVWKGMIERCTDPNARSYPRYGGKGVKVCQEWLDSFEAFYEHVGKRPSLAHTLDRIENSKGYEPGNVRWATRHTQSRNTSRNVRLNYQGRVQVLEDWAKELGIPKMTIWNRIFRLGWTTEKALSKPVMRKNDGEHHS